VRLQLPPARCQPPTLLLSARRADASIQLMTLNAFREACQNAAPSPLFLFCLHALSVAAFGQAPVSKTATSQEIKNFFRSKAKTTLTFVGYSGTGYENQAAMLDRAEQILTEFDASKTIVNIGATPDGIGEIYKVAKQRGFLTTGIVSTQAKEAKVPLSPFVDFVFYVRDATWGGNLDGTHRLSPTSEAMVENSDIFVGIGGGEVARDELLAAKRSGKKVLFFPADMNHRKAVESAKRKGLPIPTEFRGAAAAAF
jgi:hypothetical protein